MKQSVLETLMETVLAQDADPYHGVDVSSISKVDREIMLLRKSISDVGLMGLYEKTMNSVKAICDEYMFCIFKKGFAIGLKIYKELEDR